MKIIWAMLFLSLICLLHGDVEAKFKTPKVPKVGESTGFELTKSNRVIMNTGDGKYVVLDLINSSSDGGEKTSTEACSISWTLIGNKSVKAGVANAFIRYGSEKMKDGSTMLTAIGGTDTVEVGGVKIRWSYGSSERVFLYPSPDTKYATIQVEQDGGGNAPELPSHPSTAPPKLRATP